ncbi:hypothetical protein DPMN_118126 [Dreissena polymorpha]|uniref:Uncharacterized protein n=1 Tax=Dreissena polymorpha TaxID=45954 RepID=A0A9D4GGX7_DREPO|nr:hypothetical protein DPMN_118126 [Dreissena polymorpha]
MDTHAQGSMASFGAVVSGESVAEDSQYALYWPRYLKWEPYNSFMSPSLCPRATKLGRLVSPSGPRLRQVRTPASVPSFLVKVSPKVRYTPRICSVTLKWDTYNALMCPSMCLRATKLGRLVCPNESHMRQLRPPVTVPSFPVKVSQKVRYPPRLRSVIL